jgi:hypothetical protein
MRITYSITLALLGCLCGGTVEAQQAHIKVPAVRVIDEEGRAYRVGEALKLNLDYRDLKPLGGANNLQVRIFKASREALLHRFKNLASDGCVIYPSRLYKAREYDGGIRILSTSSGSGRPSPVILTESWLATGGDLVFDQYYLLVFEQKGEPGEILKLREQDVEPYFRIGYEFVVKAPARPLKGMQVAALAREESAAQAEAFERMREVAARTGVVEESHLPSLESVREESLTRPKVPCKAFARIEIEHVARLLSTPCGCEAAAGGLVAAFR